MKPNVISVLLALLVLLGTCSANVYLENSRAHLCFNVSGVFSRSCGWAAKHPGYILGPKGFARGGPRDQMIASAGRDEYRRMDEFGKHRWSPVSSEVIRSAPSTMELAWFINTTTTVESFEYYITQNDWDSNAPLTRRTGWKLIGKYNNGWEHQAPTKLYSLLEFDFDSRRGHHVILAVLNLKDSPYAYYAVMDVMFDGKDKK